MAKNKVPKKVLGASVPKFLRRSDILQTLFGTSLGRQILADALVAAAGAAAIALTRSDTTKKAGKAAIEGGVVAKEAFQSAASAASGVIASAAQGMLGSGKDNARSRKRHH